MSYSVLVQLPPAWSFVTLVGFTASKVAMCSCPGFFLLRPSPVKQVLPAVKTLSKTALCFVWLFDSCLLIADYLCVAELTMPHRKCSHYSQQPLVVCSTLILWTLVHPASNSTHWTTLHHHPCLSSLSDDIVVSRDVFSVETSRSRDVLTSRLGLGPMLLGSRSRSNMSLSQPSRSHLEPLHLVETFCAGARYAYCS